MQIEKDHDLGLSLCLMSSPEARRSIRLNLMLSTPLPPKLLQSSPGCPDNFRSQSDLKTSPHSRGVIDVNYAPVTEIDTDEEAGSTVSNGRGRGKQIPDVVGGEEADAADPVCFRGMSDEEDGEVSRKKLRLSKEQAVVLEESFRENSTLNHKQKLELASKLSLRPRQVEVWFQNRRARTKLKQTEVDCEFLKLCCENLTEENRRLKKEVQDLKVLKLSPQLYMPMAPPTTLTMCPSCERIAIFSPAAAPPPPPSVTLPRADIHFARLTRPPAAAPPPWSPLVQWPSFLDDTSAQQRS